MLASKQDPASPPGDSGAQSSTPKRTLGLLADQERVVHQVSTLMSELVESRPQLTTMENCRVQSIHQALKNLGSELQEIKAKNLAEHSTISLQVEEKGERVSIGQAKPSEQRSAKPSERELAKPPQQELAKPSGMPKPGSLESIMAKRKAKDISPPEHAKTPQLKEICKPKGEGKSKTEGVKQAILPLGSAPPPSKPMLPMTKDLAQAGPPPKAAAPTLVKDQGPVATGRQLVSSPKILKATPPPSPFVRKGPLTENHCNLETRLNQSQGVKLTQQDTHQQNSCDSGIQTRSTTSSAR